VWRDQVTDKTHFHLSGSVNKHDYSYWAPENSQEFHQTALHNDKLTVWCGIMSFGLLGPHFFEDQEGAAATVTLKHYVEMLCNFCEPELHNREIDFPSVWFSDGTTAHTAWASMSLLQEMFPQHTISHGRDVP
jgi:hypothetical protein